MAEDGRESGVRWVSAVEVTVKAISFRIGIKRKGNRNISIPYMFFGSGARI